MKNTIIKILFFSLMLGFFSFSNANYQTTCNSGYDVLDNKIDNFIEKIDNKIKNKPYGERKRILYKIIDICQNYLDKFEKNQENKKIIWVLTSIQCKINTLMESYANNLDSIFNNINDVVKNEEDTIYLKNFWIKYKIPKSWKKLNITTHYEYTDDWKMLVFNVWFPNSVDFLHILQIPISEYKKALNCNNNISICIKNNIIWKNSKYFYILWTMQDVNENNKQLVEVLKNLDYVIDSIKVIEIEF